MSNHLQRLDQAESTVKQIQRAAASKESLDKLRSDLKKSTVRCLLFAYIDGLKMSDQAYVSLLRKAKR